MINQLQDETIKLKDFIILYRRVYNQDIDHYYNHVYLEKETFYSLQKPM